MERRWKRNSFPSSSNVCFNALTSILMQRPLCDQTLVAVCPVHPVHAGVVQAGGAKCTAVCFPAAHVQHGQGDEDLLLGVGERYDALLPAFRVDTTSRR